MSGEAGVDDVFLAKISTEVVNVYNHYYIPSS